MKKFKHLLYLKEYQDVFLNSDVTPRFNLKSDHPVEQFYKRHMNNDQPIPQVIVVGILRVLLTTCPNNQRNAGGIDLHAEWSSCLNFLIHHKDFFKERQFKSKAFEKTDALLDFVPKAERERPEEEEEQEKLKIEMSDGEEAKDEELMFAKMKDYQFEMDRHRIIVAMIISDFFLFMLKHFKANHLVQFMYLS